MFRIAIALYRSWPLRPHCNAANGTHVLMCRKMGLAPEWCKDLPGPIPN